MLLNLVWAVASTLLVALWLLWSSFARRTRREVAISALALIVLVVILLPVISITDDRLAMQSSADSERAMRRDESANAVHPVPATIASLIAFFWTPREAPILRALVPIRSVGRTLERSSITTAVRPPPVSAISLA